MKRTLVIVGIVLGILGVGVTAAFAGGDTDPSYTCRDGLNETQATVPGYAVGAEGGQQGPGETGVTVCYSDTPNGSPSNVAGGFFHVRQDQDGETFLWCNADPGAVFTFNCFSAGYVQTTDDEDPNTVGRTVSAQVIVADDTLGETGVQVGPITSVNLPGDATPGSGGSVVVGPGTCTYADGVEDCSPSGTTVAGVTVAEQHLVPGTNVQQFECVKVNGVCQVPIYGAAVEVGSEDQSPTVDATTAAGPLVTDDVDYLCIEAGADCP